MLPAGYVMLYFVPPPSSVYTHYRTPAAAAGAVQGLAFIRLESSRILALSAAERGTDADGGREEMYWKASSGLFVGRPKSMPDEMLWDGWGLIHDNSMKVSQNEAKT